MKQINGLAIPSAFAEICTPCQTALLVYDMQAGIVSQVKNGPAITRGAVTAVKAARAAGMRIVYTRHLSLPKTWMGVTAFRMAMAWQRKDEPDLVHPWFLRDTPPFEIVPELAPRPEDAVFDKLAMSAFEGTPLATALRDCGILGLAIVGIATEIGIEPTARHAADLGFIPVLLTDACGAGHHEAGERSIEALKFAGDAMFSDVAEFSRLIGAGTA
jgi:nicotinamidase-related amidase